jgi:PAS domain S-box-containing protein
VNDSQTPSPHASRLLETPHAPLDAPAPDGRLTALRRTGLLDSPAEEAFDRLTRLASRATGAPVALVSLVDEHRQFFKSQLGLPEPWAAGRETPLSHSFCQHVVDSGGPLVIEDAREHPLVRDNLAIPDLGVVAYAGVPLTTSDGHTLGSFCAIDTQPRAWSAEDVALLEDLAATAVARIESEMALAEARAARELVTARELRFRALVERSTDAVALVGADSTVMYASPATEHVRGLRPEEVLGLRALDLVHPEDSREARAAFSRVLAAPGAAASIEARVRHADGGWRWLDVRARNLLDDPFVRAVVVNYRDVTERRAAADALEATNRELAAALDELRAAQATLVEQERLRALGQMASGIAHDFNNALAPVVGFSELLLAVPDALADTAQVREYLELIHTGATDAASIVERLREVYRPREEDEAFGPVDLPRIVEQVVALCQPRWRDQARADGRTITVETDLVAVPSVPGREPELREALTNLIFNAVDAMPAGGTITVAARPAPGEGGDVLLSVADRGVGMSEDVRRRALEPFFTTKGTRGTGLGLSMVHGIVQRHGGTLEIESHVGRGTAITLRLPSGAAPPEDAGPRQSHADARRSLRVLVVDDEPQVLRVAAAYLEAEGHTTVPAGSGGEALALLQAGGFDLVVTDRAMPGMSGVELAEAVKRRFPATPVVLLSGFGVFMAAVGERPAPVDAVVGKPLTLPKLRETLERVFGPGGRAAVPAGAR